MKTCAVYIYPQPSSTASWTLKWNTRLCVCVRFLGIISRDPHLDKINQHLCWLHIYHDIYSCLFGVICLTDCWQVWTQGFKCCTLIVFCFNDRYYKHMPIIDNYWKISCTACVCWLCPQSRSTVVRNFLHKYGFSDVNRPVWLGQVYFWHNMSTRYTCLSTINAGNLSHIGLYFYMQHVLNMFLLFSYVYIYMCVCVSFLYTHIHIYICTYLFIYIYMCAYWFPYYIDLSMHTCAITMCTTVNWEMAFAWSDARGL